MDQVKIDLIESRLHSLTSAVRRDADNMDPKMKDLYQSEIRKAHERVLELIKII